jgi:hypothetical protein
MIRSKANNDKFREGYDRIFSGNKSDWTAGRSIAVIKAIRIAARVHSIAPEKVAEDLNSYREFLYSIN